MKRLFLFPYSFFVLASSAQPIVRPLLQTGASSNRITLAFLAEGFTAGEFDTFMNSASNVLDRFLQTTPFSEYKTCFNAYAIFVPSNESGSDHPASGIFKDTYFNSSYDTYGYYYATSIPPNDRSQNYADGQGKVDALLQLLPKCDIPIMIINDPAYGGSGGRVPMCSVAPASLEIAIHEIGHSFAGLGDEYTAPYPGFPVYDEPNTTQETNRDLIKWKAWINPETPIPTTDPFGSPVGLFEGARYFSAGWYRPQWDCKMRTLGQPFCVVCREALVKAFYKRIRPTENIFPEPNTVYPLSSDSVLSLSVNPIHLPAPSIHVQWQLNKIDVPGETNSTFSLQGSVLTSATNTVTAVVHDPTPFVRNDPKNLLTSSNTWTVVAVPSKPRLTANIKNALSLSYSATATNYNLQVASSVGPGAAWQNVTTNPTIQNGEKVFMFPIDAAKKFFRLVLKP